MEIERKFLVLGDVWRHLTSGVFYRQGYLSTVKERVVRVRVVGDHGYLTIKGITRSVSRLELEYPIPLQDANLLLDKLCKKPIIEKMRYDIHDHEDVWHVDEFLGENQGLVVAEIELAQEDEPFTKPDWIGEEVSHDPRYFNSNLVRNPYRAWTIG